MIHCVCLDPTAKKVSADASGCPRIYQLPPPEGRKVLENLQKNPHHLYPASSCKFNFDTGEWGTIPVYCVTPEGGQEPLSVILYLHGGGWVFGSYFTHLKLLHELACRTNSLVIFPEYSRSPEAKYPTALEQCYSVLCQIPALISLCECKATLKTLTVAGDSVGGNFATILTILSKYRNGPYIQKQLLYYPVTNACFDTLSYNQFSDGYYLYRDGMIWFWNQYIDNNRDRYDITASPLRASTEQLRLLPEAMIINGEADVLHDEGQAYASHLCRAGVKVTALTIHGMIHDFVMLNALDQTPATRAAMDVSCSWINRKNGYM